jgi:NADH-quinone oxidoreductase subunit A
MTELVAYLLLFVGVGLVFVFFHLCLGRLVRPTKPHAEKLTIYECGEPTIGSAWVQFDLRYYVVALLFVIFDVEVAFFFPWAVVFGHATTVAKVTEAPDGQANPPRLELAKRELLRINDGRLINSDEVKAAGSLAWIAFWDIAVFFGVLLVGFAYLWKRGDIDWVRSVAAEQPVADKEGAPASTPSLAGAAADNW